MLRVLMNLRENSDIYVWSRKWGRSFNIRSIFRSKRNISSHSPHSLTDALNTQKQGARMLKFNAKTSTETNNTEKIHHFSIFQNSVSAILGI